MRYREFLKSRLGDAIPDNIILPSGFHLVGHVALLHVDFQSIEIARKIGDATLDYDHRVKSVAVKTGPTEGRTRKPSYEVVAGDCNTVTTHIESGVKFRIDPIRLTFSGGNRRERIRLSQLVKPGEVVVDMFSCVGQFALHIAKATDAEVTAIEINPEAYTFLTENITLNNLEEQVTAILGDCREVHPKAVANRVVMGYLHNTISYLSNAIETLTDKGGTIHMHMTQPKLEVEQTIQKIERICEDYGFHSDTKMFHVKNYSPGIEHYVFDINVI